MRIILGILIILHGLIHFLYFGQSARFFELKPGMVWPDGSWIFTKLLGNEGTRNLANISLILAGVVLIISGAGILVNQAWWRLVVLGAAAFSSLVYILLWNGRWKDLDGQGLVGILINFAILLAVGLFRWPAN